MFTFAMCLHSMCRVMGKKNMYSLSVCEFFVVVFFRQMVICMWCHNFGVEPRISFFLVSLVLFWRFFCTLDIQMCNDGRIMRFNQHLLLLIFRLHNESFMTLRICSLDLLKMPEKEIYRLHIEYHKLNKYKLIVHLMSKLCANIHLQQYSLA